MTFFCETIDARRIGTYSELRKEVHALQAHLVCMREARNPVKSPLEQYLGVYVEELEPQMVSAVLTLNAIGYETFSSGFMESDSARQHVAGWFQLDPDTKLVLEAEGVKVQETVALRHCVSPDGSPYILEGPVSVISFFAGSLRLSEIESRWRRITNIFPDRSGDPRIE